jgi:hypothetical protein
LVFAIKIEKVVYRTQTATQKPMTVSSSRFSRWLTILAGGIAATLAALWVARRLNTPQAAVADAGADSMVMTPTFTAPPVIESPRPIRLWRAALSWLIGVPACVALIVAAVVFQNGIPNNAPNILLAGAGGLVVALFINPPMSARWKSELYIRESFRWLHMGLGLLCLGVLLIFNLSSPITISGHVQFLLLCIGIASLTYGFGGKLLPAERKTMYVVGMMTVIALLLRVVALDSAIHFFIDEANFADGTRIAMAINPPLLERFSGITAFPWVYPYMESMAADLFGRNLFSLRVVSAIFGTLTIPAVYILARALFNKPTALVAALLLATFPPHIHFSRIALNNIADPLFGTLALGWFAWGWRSGRRGYFAMAGAALGLTQYFYDGGRLLFPPLVIAWTVCCVMLMWLRNEDRRGKAGGALLMLTIAFIIAAPVYIVSAAQNLPFSERFNREGTAASVLTIRDIVQRLWDTFLMYTQYIDGSFFYRGEKPLLLVFTAAPFLVGIVYAAWRTLRLDYGGLLLIFWVLITSAGNALLTTPFVSARYVVVFPALMVLASLGLYLLSQILLRREAWVRYVLIVVVPIIAIAQSTYYFNVHVPLYNDQSRVHEDSQDAAFRSANFPRGTQVHIVADPVAYHSYARAVMWYLRDDVPIDTISPLELTPEYMTSLTRGVDHAFYLLPEDSASLLMVRRYFNVTGPQRSPNRLPPNREFWLFYASRAQNP